MNKYLLAGEESERLLFRKADSSDFDAWLAFHQDPATSAHWNMEPMLPEDACRQWLAAQFYRYKNDLGGLNALIHKTTGQLIGFCGLLVQNVDGDEELEIGYSILPKYWNKGYASEAARRCRDFAFSNELADSLISIISPTNIASKKVALKNDMELSTVSTYKNNLVNIFRIDSDKWAGIC